MLLEDRKGPPDGSSLIFFWIAAFMCVPWSGLTTIAQSS